MADRVQRYGYGGPLGMITMALGQYVPYSTYAKLETELRDTRRALERLRTNARYIFDKKAVRDWAETLAEVDEVLSRRTGEIKGRLEE